MKPLPKYNTRIAIEDFYIDYNYGYYYMSNCVFSEYLDCFKFGNYDDENSNHTEITNNEKLLRITKFDNELEFVLISNNTYNSEFNYDRCTTVIGEIIIEENSKYLVKEKYPELLL